MLIVDSYDSLNACYILVYSTSTSTSINVGFKLAYYDHQFQINVSYKLLILVKSKISVTSYENEWIAPNKYIEKIYLEYIDHWIPI